MSARLLDWDCASRAYPGEAVSGDAATVVMHDYCAVVAVAAGLGHGKLAAAAAQSALDIVRTEGETDLVRLVERCHSALRDTRGATMSIASIDTSPTPVRWLGIGNVEGRIVRTRPSNVGRADALMLAPGIVGHELPRLRPASAWLQRGDLLVIATDGIAGAYADRLEWAGSCKGIAQRVLERHGSATDDALVMVVRYLGGEG